VEALHRHDLEGHEFVSKILFRNKALTKLTAALAADGEVAYIPDGDYAAWLEDGEAGDYFYAILRSSANREIIKVNITGSSVATGLSIERGQESTDARAWPQGTLMFQHLTAAALTNIIQKEAFRTVTYNPNDTLAAAYANEKVYQSDEQVWWMAVATGSTEWRLIAGEYGVADPVFDPDGGDYYYGDAVEITCSTDSTTIYYTTDGTDPDQKSTPYTEAVTLPEDGDSITIKAIAIHDDRWWTPSDIITKAFTRLTVATPVLDPAGGEFYYGDTVEMTCATADTEIYYSTDGSDPDYVTGTLYEGAVTVPNAASVTLKAVAYHGLHVLAPSEIATAEFSRIGPLIICETTVVGYDYTEVDLTAPLPSSHSRYADYEEKDGSLWVEISYPADDGVKMTIPVRLGVYDSNAGGLLYYLVPIDNNEWYALEYDISYDFTHYSWVSPEGMDPCAVVSLQNLGYGGMWDFDAHGIWFKHDVMYDAIGSYGNAVPVENSFFGVHEKRYTFLPPGEYCDGLIPILTRFRFRGGDGCPFIVSSPVYLHIHSVKAYKLTKSEMEAHMLDEVWKTKYVYNYQHDTGD
jgi:hypothetical protein